MEHVIPISKGGEHHLGNIVPACQRCNYSKHTSEVQAWYRSQPFFDETRWDHIQSLLAQSQPSFQQLVFL
jgi:5-methylcytosine-specific restriction endonuclease McrA